jgi:hypothetical protein
MPVDALDEPEGRIDPVIARYRLALKGVNVADITRFSSGVEGEIMRDVLRTFQNLAFFQEDHLGRVMLAKVLVAVSRTADATVGYCQGMNFVVGIFLQSAVPDSDAQEASLLEDLELQEQIESQIFDLMLALIDKDGKLCMLGLWAEKIPKLKLRVYQLDRLLRWFCPRLHAHFTVIELSPEVLTAQWFITLFAYTLSAKDTMRIWDYVFLSGWEGLFRVAVSLLGIVEQVLLQVSDMEGVSMLMKQWRGHSRGMLLDSLTVEEVLDKARQQSERQLTEEALLKLSEAYAWELLLLGQLRCRELGLITTTTDSTKGSPMSADSDQENSPTSSIHSNNKSRNSGDSETDKPTYWLTRYAYKLTPPVSLELCQISQTVRQLDSQIDTDKGMMTQKILAACTSHTLLEMQRQCVSQCVSRLRYRAIRLRRRLDRVATQAKNVATYASNVCFALQQVQLLDTQLQIAQNTGKMPMCDGISTPDQRCSMNSHRRGRLLHSLLFNSSTASSNKTGEIESDEIMRKSIENEAKCKDSRKFSNSGFVFGSRSAHSPHPLHSNVTGYTPKATVLEGSESPEAQWRSTGLGGTFKSSSPLGPRRQRLRALLLPSPQSRHSSTRTSSSSDDSAHGYTQVLHGLQNLVHGIHDFLLSTTTSSSALSAASSTALDPATRASSESRFSSSPSKAATAGQASSSWTSSALPAMVPAVLASVLSSYYYSSFSPLSAYAQQHHSDEMQFLSSETTSNMLPMSATSDFSQYIQLQLQLHVQPPLVDEEFRLIGDLDRDSIVVNNSTKDTVETTSSSTDSTLSFDNSVDASVDRSTSQKCNATAADDHGALIIDIASGEDTFSVDTDPVEQLRRLENKSREAQRRMIVLQRALSETERVLGQQERLLLHLSMREDEASNFKSRLCDQLHLLVEDSNRGRAQKLLYVADHFLL